MTADPSGKQEFHFSQGQSVRIVEGPFTEFVGTVSESNREQRKVTVVISYWGKPTRVVFDFRQIEKITPFYRRCKTCTMRTGKTLFLLWTVTHTSGWHLLRGHRKNMVYSESVGTCAGAQKHNLTCSSLQFPTLILERHQENRIGIRFVNSVRGPI